MQKLNKYNNVIITKRQDNICELQFINKDQKEIINSDDYAFLEKQLSFLKNRTKEINELKQAVSILSKNKIKSFENKIENISSHEEKLIRGKGSWSYAFFLPKIPLDTIKTKELIVNKKQNIKINIATIYNKDFKGTDIPEPTAEQLNVISKDYSFNSPTAQWNNLEEWRKNYASNIVSMNVFTNNKKRPVINQEEAREIYYKLQEFDINEYAIGKYEKEYLDNITDKELYKHYEDHLNTLNEELKTITKYSKILKKILHQNHILKELATPQIFPRIVEGKTKGMKLLDLYKTKQNNVQDLLIILEGVAPDIYKKLAHYRKEELEEYILENSQEIITYIDGAKLTILEDRAFCALRYLAVKAFNQGLVISPSVEITCKPSDIYKLSGVPYTKEKGYHTEQRLVVKNAITNKEGNLRKPIHIEYKQQHKDGKAILSTNFIKKVHWNDEKDQVKFEIDNMFFVNVPGQDNKDYWLDDVIGRVGYISTLEQGFKNERQYKLHKYLASCLRKKISFNVTTLLEQSGLINDHKLGKKKSAITKLQSYLDGMYEYGTLIKNKPIKVPSKSDPKGKYEFERI